MPKLELLLANPTVRRVSRPDVTWFLTGCEETEAHQLERVGNARDGIEPDICISAGDATILKIVHDQNSAHRISAWRGPTSKYEVFRMKKENGDLIIADHFRNLMAQLPIAERMPSDESIIDHYLFRAPVGHNTYCRKIHRLGSGEHLSIELISRESDQSIFKKLDDAPVRRTVSEYLNDVDLALADVLGVVKEQTGIAALFSGGVDSTLLQTYLGPKTAALNLIVDVRDAGAQMEAQYAQDAADRLGITLERREVRRSEFLEDLELATENIAMPVLNSSLAVFSHLFANEYETYLAGWNADALFGHSTVFRRVGSFFANPFLLCCLQLSVPVIARSDQAQHNIWRERLEQLLPLAREMSMPPESVRGFGQRAETYVEFDMLEMIFGTEAVAKRLTNRFEYVAKRAALTAPQSDTFSRHCEIASWVELLCDDFGSQMRHLATANDKAVLLPYLSGSVVGSALRIPANERYLRRWEGKYILKGLLRRRLPGYPTHQRKGATFLAPFPQYYRAGPLSRIWDRYQVPDFLCGPVRDQILSSPLRLTYSAISYAIWTHRVHQSSSLGLLSGVRRHSWQYAIS